MIHRSKIRELFFLTKDGGIMVLHIPYVKKYDDPALTSAFISAIGIFANMGVGKLETISRERTDLLMFEGEQVVLAAIVEKGMNLSEFKFEAKDLLENFEDTFQWQLKRHDGNINGYNKFVLEVCIRFPMYWFDDDVVLSKGSFDLKDIKYNGVIKEALERLSEAVNGHRTIHNIIEATWRIGKEEEIIAYLGLGYHYGYFIQEKSVVKKKALMFVERDVVGRPYPTYIMHDMLEYMYDAFGEDQMNTLLPLCDGTKTIEEIAEELNVAKEVILFVVVKLIGLGALVMVDKGETKFEELEWSL